MTVFEALVDERRRRILDELRGGERSVGELVDALGAAQPAVSKHLRVLREAGLVTRRVAGPQRFYRLRPEPLREVDAWVEPYRAMWTAALDQLERHLDHMPDEKPTGRRRER